MTTAFQLLQEKLLELAREAIPAQSTNPFWKNKVDNVEACFPKLLKPGKEYTKDGVSGQYDPSFNVSLRVPGEKDLAEFAEDIAKYEVPAPDKISKGYNDSIEAYVAAVRKLPPFTWGVKIKNRSRVAIDIARRTDSITLRCNSSHAVTRGRTAACATLRYDYAPPRPPAPLVAGDVGPTSCAACSRAAACPTKERQVSHSARLQSAGAELGA